MSSLTSGVSFSDHGWRSCSSLLHALPRYLKTPYFMLDGYRTTTVQRTDTHSAFLALSIWYEVPQVRRIGIRLESIYKNDLLSQRAAVSIRGNLYKGSSGILIKYARSGSPAVCIEPKGGVGRMVLCGVLESSRLGGVPQTLDSLHRCLVRDVCMSKWDHNSTMLSCRVHQTL